MPLRHPLLTSGRALGGRRARRKALECGGKHNQIAALPVPIAFERNAGLGPTPARGLIRSTVVSAEAGACARRDSKGDAVRVVAEHG